MPKRLVVVGHSEEGLELLPALEANPEVEICAIVSDDPMRVEAQLRLLDLAAARRLGPRITTDLQAALATPGLTAVIDAEATPEQRDELHRVPGLQVTTPVLARLLYAFGPVDAFSKPDLIQALREILDSYNLALDRRGLLDRVLQVAVTATGADRGSLMLWDPEGRQLRVAVALGIEDELIPKIRVQAGEGIAGRAFAAERAILLHGKADRSRYQITRERDDVESAIAAPLLHDGRAIGVLNLSHARHRNLFNEEDLDFVEQLAKLDARLIARAEEYHGLLRESETLRAEARVRRLLAGEAPLAERLRRVCELVAAQLVGGVCRLYLRDAARDELVLQAASVRVDPLAMRERLAPGSGLVGVVARSGRPAYLSAAEEPSLRSAAIPLARDETLIGVIQLEGVDESGAAGDLQAERLEAMSGELARELAEALRAARLERESARNQALNDLLAAMAASRDANEVYALITASACSILQAQDAVLRLRDDNTGRYQIVAWHGIGQWRKAALASLEKRLASDAIRTGQLVSTTDPAADPSLADHAAGIGSAMIQPILQDGRAVGSLSVLGKVPEEPLLGESFEDSDQLTLARLVRNVQVGLGELRERERAQRSQRIDPPTGLANRSQLHDRLEEELARSRVRGHRFALLEIHFSGLAPVLEQQRSADADRLPLALARALRRGLRDFDVLARTELECFAVLVPEPEGEIAGLLSLLYRLGREALEELGEPVSGVELRLGYALYPEDGKDAAALEARAREPRVEAV